MAMRAIWSGSLEVGLLSIPIKIYKGTESNAVPMHLACDACNGEIHQTYHCAACGDLEGKPKNKRFVAGDKVVVLTPEDLATLPLKSSKEIEVQQFVHNVAKAVPNGDFYYAAVDDAKGKNKSAVKRFALLHSGMEKTGTLAVAKLALRDREHLVCFMPKDGKLAVQGLCWSEEVRGSEELQSAKAAEKELTPSEMELIVKFIRSKFGEFDPSQYRDEYSEALQKLVEAKLEGKAVEPVAQKIISTADESLEKLLEASLESETKPKGKKVRI